jgi:hypothetical protein
MANKQRPALGETAREYLLDNTLYRLAKTLDQDMELDANFKTISIGHTVTSGWSDTVEVLLDPEQPEVNYLQTDLMQPTGMRVNVVLKEQYKLSRLSQVQVSMRPLNLKLDYKDVDLLYMLAKRGEQMAQQLNGDDLFKNLNERLSRQVDAAIEAVSKEREEQRRSL